MMQLLSSAKRTLKRLFGKDASPPPATADASYQARIAAELRNFENCVDVHELPQIFHYWSNKYLAPKLNRFGITDPEQFFFLNVSKFREKHPGKPLRIVSLGSGNCDMEARLARRLLDNGVSGFTIACLDINETMLERGREHARSLHVENQIDPQYGDLNDWRPTGSYDIVMANQCLHHVLELEILFDRIKGALDAAGLFLVSDMIGRNGHQRWPEALAIVNELWRELPDAYRYNRMLKRQEAEYINHDCSTASFEGIRAQDILPLLTQKFYFDLFIPFANVIFVFIDRPFGHNFDANADWDRNFIDRVHERDEAGMLSGTLTPTQMLAVLCKNPVTPTLLDARLTPEFCIRKT